MCHPSALVLMKMYTHHFLNSDYYVLLYLTLTLDLVHLIQYICDTTLV